jgi:hypothetical protein
MRGLVPESRLECVRRGGYESSMIFIIKNLPVYERFSTGEQT